MQKVCFFSLLQHFALEYYVLPLHLNAITDKYFSSKNIKQGINFYAVKFEERVIKLSFLLLESVAKIEP